jgi:putative membrane protein
MKQQLPLLLAFVLAAGMGCSSTDTSSDTTSVSTAETALSDSAATTLTTAAGARGTGLSSTDMSDAAFLIEAASSNLMEVELGTLAAETSTDAEVKKYGQMMVDHHTKAHKDLQVVAASMKVELPTTLNQLHREMAGQLKGKTGAGFQEAYMDLMEKAHKRDIDMFVAKTTSAENPAVKDFAVRMLPILRSHLEMADRLEDTVD